MGSLGREGAPGEGARLLLQKCELTDIIIISSLC